VQGALFAPAAASRSDTAIIKVHGVEQFWYAGPAMFLATSLAGSGAASQQQNLL
jgi:enolase